MNVIRQAVQFFKGRMTTVPGTNEGARRNHAWPIAITTVAIAAVATGWSAGANMDEPSGFAGRVWGAPWVVGAIRSLPGCGSQGELVVDENNFVVRVGQPECIGYRGFESVETTLILFHGEKSWHDVEASHRVVRDLALNAGIYGLSSEQARRARSLTDELEHLIVKRRMVGHHRPVLPAVPHSKNRVPDHLLGLQAYQIVFRPEFYPRFKTDIVTRRGLPTATQLERRPGAGETLLWWGEKTLTVLREQDGIGSSGYLLVVTRSYLDFASPSDGRLGSPREVLERLTR